MAGLAGAASLTDLPSEYRIFETNRFQKDLKQIVRGGYEKVEAKLRDHVYPELRRHPHAGPHIKKLKAYETMTWRYRIGVWRFFYEINEEERVIVLIGASHRSSAY
jgi:mRNA interferase RelE/StbE